MLDLILSSNITWPGVLAALAIVLLSGFTVHVLYRRPPEPLGSVLPIVFLAGLVFSIGDLVVTLAGTSPMTHWVGLVLLYTGLIIFAPAWLIFTLRYTRIYAPGLLPSTRIIEWLPIVSNAILFVGLLTNPWHGFFLEAQPGAQSDYQILWYLTAGSNYSLIFVTLVLQFMVSMRAEDALVRSQTRFIMAGTVIPLVASLFYISKLWSFPFDPTALGFCVSCGIFVFAIYRRSFFVIQGVSLPQVLKSDTDAVLVGNPERRIVYANPVATRLFSEDALVPGLSLVGLLARRLPWIDLGLLNATGCESAASLGTSELPFERADGSLAWLTAEITPLTARRGRNVGFCLRLRDRTELREATRSIEAHAALIESVNLATGQAVLVTDRKGKVRYANEAYSKLWGFSEDFVAHQDAASLRKVFSEMLPELPARMLENPWHEDHTMRFNDDLRLADGRVIEVSSFPVNHEPGFSGRVWQMADVTKSRREETAMLHTQKLEGLGVLAGGIAHDFNNLLVAMLGNAEMARRELDPSSPLRAYLEDIETAAERATELTSQLLAYTGKGKFVFERIDLSELVRSVTELLSISNPKKVSIRYALSKDLPAIRGGAGQLRQIVMNLVTNAADAMGHRRGAIELMTGVAPAPAVGVGKASMTYGETAGPSVYLRVIDDGVGMNQKTLSRIFDPFFTTKFAGRGLGLAATQGIIRSHHGSLEVESDVGKGTVFTVYLPVDRETEVHSTRPVQVDPAVEESRSLLVVDDEDHVRAVTQRMLESAGFEVHTARDGVEAIEIYRRYRDEIDVVVLDLMMPRMGGREAMGKLLEIDPEVRVLLCSGYTEEDANQQFDVSDSNVGFIHKPFRRIELLDWIGSLIGAGKGRAA